MTRTIDTAFAPLPHPRTSRGPLRRCGIEVEFAGLSERATAKLIAKTLGGTVEEASPHRLTVKNTTIGDVGVELDTRYSSEDYSDALDTALTLARALVPVEIVTGPLTPAEMNRFLQLMDALQDDGAQGTNGGLLWGFGIHFNPEVSGFDDPHTLNTITAYALVETWMRRWRPVDPSRRLLPFISPWPSAFADVLLAEPPTSLDALHGVYRRHMSNRNFGLDLLPLLKAQNADRFRRLFGEDHGAARPTFHFRLPDCRIGEKGWSITDEWDRWVLVEAIAADTALLQRLKQMRRANSDAWEDQVEALLTPRLGDLLA